MTKGEWLRRSVLVCGLLPILFLGMGSRVATGQQAPRTLIENKARNQLTTIPGANRVNSPLRKNIEEMQARGITSQNARERGAKAFSNRLVKVDEEGKIQTYVHFHSFGDGERAALEQRGVAIETVNQDLGIIQAWIPFSRVYEVAQLPFVKRITPQVTPSTTWAV
jgi:hypothetical protein